MQRNNKSGEKGSTIRRDLRKITKPAVQQGDDDTAGRATSCVRQCPAPPDADGDSPISGSCWI